MGEPTAGLTERKPRIEVVRATDAHATALAEFYRAVWDRDATPESVREARARAAATNPAEPGADVPSFLFLGDGKVLGHIGTIPARFWDGATEHRGYWFNGFMVLPEHRNGPVGFSVLKEALRHLDLTAVLTVALPSRRLFAAMGFVDRGAVPNHLLLLRPGAVLRSLDIEALGLGGRLPAWMARAVRLAQRSGAASLAGALGGAGLALWKEVRGAGAGGVTIHSGPAAAAPDELDALWRRAREGLAAAQVRDGAYLAWRYGASHGDTYAMGAVRERGTLVGVAVVRRPRADGDPRLRGIRVATLSDVLFPPDRAGLGVATLRAAERVARAMGADALLCTASHPALAAALRRRAFVRLPGNVHFMLRDAGMRGAWPAALDDWWITRGDAEADGVF